MFQLLFPFQWWYAYAPILARNMLEAYHMPQPYVLGLRPKHEKHIGEVKEVVIVDVDAGEVDTSSLSTPLTPLPLREGRNLRKRLRHACERLNARSDEVIFRAKDDPKAQMDSFDVEVYRATLRFYAELLTGYRTFLFFMNDVPFFNGAGFLAMKRLKDPDADNFYEKFVASRAFNVFIEEEFNPNVYHDLMANGAPTKELDGILDDESQSLDYYDLQAPALSRPAQPTTTTSKNSYASRIRKVDDEGRIRKVEDEGRENRQPGSNPFPLRSQFLSKIKPIRLKKGTTRSNSSMRKPKHIESVPSNTPEQKLKVIMSRVFSSDSVGQESQRQMRALLKKKQHRSIVAAILQQPRQTRGAATSLCLTLASYEALAQIFKTMLDCCEENRDYSNASAVLESGNLFFTEDTVGSRRYIETEIRNHTFWKNLLYWKQALEDAVKNRSKDKKLPELNPLSRKEFVVQWLLAAVHQMMSFGIPSQQVSTYVDDMSHRHQLDQESTKTLKQFLSKISMALDLWNQSTA